MVGHFHKMFINLHPLIPEYTCLSTQAMSSIYTVVGEGWTMPLMWDCASHRKLGVEWKNRTGQVSWPASIVRSISDYDGTSMMSSFIQTSNLRRDCVRHSADYSIDPVCTCPSSETVQCSASSQNPRQQLAMKCCTVGSGSARCTFGLTFHHNFYWLVSIVSLPYHCWNSKTWSATYVLLNKT